MKRASPVALVKINYIFYIKTIMKCNIIINKHNYSKKLNKKMG